MPQPVLHANSRQELCEYCPYFNSYQSGVYAQDGKCRGFLIDAFASYGDVFTPWAFVSHAGGKAKPKTGAPSNESSDFRLSQQFQLSESQDLEDRSVKSMKLAMDESRPVVVIMGSSYPLASSTIKKLLPGRFNILGSYLIRACWATKEYYSNPNDQHQPPSRSYHIRYKFLFQWIASEHQSNWFHNVQYPTPIPPPPKFQCPTCCHDSLHVYVTRVCLNHSCPDFFMVFNAKTQERQEFDISQSTDISIYSPDFLQPWILPPECALISPESFQLRNPRPPPFAELTIHDHLRLPSALDCLMCGRISSRVSWNTWKCLTKDCNSPEISYNFSTTNLLNEVPYVQQPMDDCGLLFKSEHSRIRQAFIETLFPATSAFYKHKTTVYYLPLGGGKVYHIRNPFMGKSGFTIADQILESFLDAKQLPLSRRTFLVHQLSGFLSQQFSFNVGKAYRYASDQPASRFEDAPSPVQSAFQHLQNLIPNLHINELLILGYLKGQKMNFHTDDEMGLGPTVVSWSFGSPAQMWFRERPVSIRRPVSEEDVNVLLDPSCMVMVSQPVVPHTSPIVKPSKSKRVKFDIPLTLSPPQEHTPLFFQPPLSLLLSNLSLPTLPSLSTLLPNISSSLKPPVQISPLKHPLRPSHFHPPLPSTTFISVFPQLPSIPLSSTILVSCVNEEGVRVQSPTWKKQSPKLTSPVGKEEHYQQPQMIEQLLPLPNDSFVKPAKRKIPWTVTSPPQTMKGKAIVVPKNPPKRWGQQKSISKVEPKKHGYVQAARRANEVNKQAEVNRIVKAPIPTTVEKPVESKEKDGRAPPNRVCLKLLLRHGDLLIMDGHSVQKYYEHSIRPVDDLRFVVTGRQIN